MLKLDVASLRHLMTFSELVTERTFQPELAFVPQPSGFSQTPTLATADYKKPATSSVARASRVQDGVYVRLHIPTIELLIPFEVRSSVGANRTKEFVGPSFQSVGIPTDQLRVSVRSSRTLYRRRFW